ncbi:MAG: alcohol dehydrogenase [Legionellales bacterium]|nr:alcohol dehydrogenase [Legionellales bacterium]|tara:strand:+ start:118 stop:1119 length:1002 start_codon:yes stop_codon:yes gene_type:complete
MVKGYAALGPGEPLQLIEYDLGPLLSDQVQIDVSYCGICHSDLSMIDNAWGMTTYPLVPGHEVAGVVSAIGSDVKHLTVGQRVGLGWHAGYCNQCCLCTSGDQNLCADATATIINHHGGFANQVRAQANSAIPIPDGLDFKSVGPLFCGGITVFNPLVQYDIKPTDHVAIIGIGGLGHMALEFLNAWGCHVTAFTSTISKRDELMQMGAKEVIDTNNIQAIESAGGRFDLILSTVNVKLNWNLYLGTLKPKGRLHFVGATLDPLDLNVFQLIMGQRQVSGSPVGSPRVIEKMLDFAHLHQLNPIVEVFEMDQVNQAITRLRSGQAHYRVVLKQ